MSTSRLHLRNLVHKLRASGSELALNAFDTLRGFPERFRRYPKTVKQRIIGGVGVGGLLTAALLQMMPVAAGVAILTPNGDHTAQWIGNGVGNLSCTLSSHCDLVNEDKGTPNTSNYISTGESGAGGEIDEFEMSSFTFPSGVTEVTSITVGIYAQSATNANGGNLDTVDIKLFIAGAYQTAVTVTPAFNTWEWHTATFTGSWTQADVDAMRVNLVHNQLGGGSPAGRDDDVRVATVYADATYPTVITFNQTAARWFSNWDGAELGVKQSNPTTGGDAATATATDGEYMYIAGYDSTGAGSWRIVKRNLDGSAVSKFGSSGVVSVDPTVNEDRITSIAVDDSYLYVGGYTSPASGNKAWRIEKRNKVSGALCDSATNCSDGVFGAAGVISADLGAGDDQVNELSVQNGYLYAGGMQYVAAGDFQGRLEKRNAKTGAFCDTTANCPEGVFGSAGVTTYNPSAAMDSITAVQVDGGYVYTGGVDATISATDGQFRIEKRNKVSGAICSTTSDCPEGVFNSTGVLQANPTSGSDDTLAPHGLAVNGGYLYLTGRASAASDSSWYIAKHNKVSGAICDGTANCADGAFNTSGFISENPSAATDKPSKVIIDEGAVYWVGSDQSQDGGTSRWRIKKFNATDGSVNSSFGTSGVVVSNPSTGNDEPLDAYINDKELLLVGTDAATTDIQWRVESRNKTTGSLGVALATQDAAIVAPSQGTPFRLRLTIDITTNPMPAASETFKLQYAVKSGTCDTSFSGEAYVDVSATDGNLRFFDNPSSADGDVTTSVADDPKHSTHPVIAQTYEEANSFMNAAEVPIDNDALWDFSLVDYSSAAGTSYCLRAVKGNDKLLGTYTVIPEVKTELYDSGIQYEANHTTVIPTGTTLIRDPATGMFLDFFAAVGSASETVKGELELQDTSTAFTGTPNYASVQSHTVMASAERRFSPCSAFDEKRNRMIVFGGRANDKTTHYNDVWAMELPKNAQPEWVKLIPDGAAGSPQKRRSCAMAYDSIGDRVILWNGWDGSTSYNEVWALSMGDNPSWTQICSTTSCGSPPSARRTSRFVFDPVNNQIVVFAGFDGARTSDTWTLSLGATPAWTQLTVTGGPPAARAGHGMAYDPVNKAVWIHGGTVAAGTDTSDVWKFDIATSTWTEVSPNGCASPCPPKADGVTLVYDSANKSLVTFAGLDNSRTLYLNTFNILSNLDTTPTWSAPTPNSNSPLPRYYHVAEYDIANHRMVAFAGFDSNKDLINKDTSALHLPTDGSTPYWRGAGLKNVMNPRDQMAPYYDAANNYAYIFGGYGDGKLPGANDSGAHQDSMMRLELPNGRVPRWRDVGHQNQSTGMPLKREATSFASDTKRKRLILFGGLNGDFFLNDVWVADIQDDGSNPVWQQLCSPTSCGTAPAARWGGTAIYDEVNDRFVIFGGRQDPSTMYNDVWALSLGDNPQWTQLAPSGTAPAARWGHATAYDKANNRMIIFSGQVGSDSSTGTIFNDVWAMSLDAAPAWSELTPTGTAPSQRRSTAYAVDDTGAATKLIVFGGYDSKATVHYNDIWVLDLGSASGAWTNPFPSDCANATAPSCRRSTAAVYNPSKNQMVIMGGRDGGTFVGDTFAFDLTGNTWTNLNPINEIRFSIPLKNLTEGSYHWQYRANGSSSGVGGYISYGTNADMVPAGTDFTYCGIPTIEKRLRQGTFFCAQAKQNKLLPR